MSTSAITIAWDTCVLIDYIDRRHPSVDQAEVVYLDSLVNEALKSGRPLIIPAFAIVETAAVTNDGPNRRVRTQAEIEDLRRFLLRDEFEVMPMDRRAGEIAQDFMRAGLSVADATIAGTCRRHGASVLLTRDGMKRPHKAAKLTAHDSPEMRIMRPKDWLEVEKRQQFFPNQQT